MTDADVIAELEARRYEAMLHSDAAALDELCAYELTYTHSDGARDTKATYLRRVRDGYFDYQWLEHEIYRTIMAGDCAIVISRMTGDVVVDGSLRHLNSAALIVWVRRPSGWRLLAFQPTPLKPC
jgi:ketosteroid isomerase-like protein